MTPCTEAKLKSSQTVIGEGSTVYHIAVSLTPGDTEDGEIALLYPASEDHVSGPSDLVQSEPSDLTTLNSLLGQNTYMYMYIYTLY